MIPAFGLMRRNDGPRPRGLPISVRIKRILALRSNLEEALSRKLTRRTLLQTAAAAAGVTALNAPFVSGAHAAGRLSCGFWDHWVPTALDPMRKICQEWADKNKVDLNIDFITSNGDKLLADDRRRGAGEVRARHTVDPDLVRRGAGRQSRADGRRHENADRRQRQGQRRRRVSRQAERQVGRGAGGLGQCHLPVRRALRPAQGACRAGRHEDVPGNRRARQGTREQLDLGHLPVGCRER